MERLLEAVTKIRITSNVLPPIEINDPFKPGAKSSGGVMKMIAPRVEIFLGDNPVGVNIAGSEPIHDAWILPTGILALGTLGIVALAVRGMVK